MASSEHSVSTYLRVLFVEDQPADADLIQRRLTADGFHVLGRRVDTEAAYLEALRDGPELVLSDWVLPGFSGLRALELHQEHGIDCPFIVVSGSIGEEAAVDLLRRGCTDYVMKDALLRLGPAVHRALAEQRTLREKRRMESAMRLQVAALEAAVNGILITDRDGVIQWVNTAFELLTGYASHEAVGRNPREILRSGAHSGTFYRTLWETILGGQAWQGEMINRRKDGSQYAEEISITPVRDTDGQISHFIAIKHDISERKRAEAAREALQAQLLQAQKMESIGQLAGGVAHDFNNMLAAITGYAELALRGIGAEHPVAAHLEAVQAAALRSAGLTRHLLAFARQQPFTPTVLDLTRAVGEMIKVLTNVLGENVRVVVEAGEASWPICADPSQIDQVVTNLAVNARDAMSGSHGSLTISTADVVVDAALAGRAATASPGDYVRLSVRDTGCGMDAATLAHIFEPFFTTKPVGSGTGLGLSTVYGIVRQHGGFCDVESTPGIGTAFHVYFPRHVTDTPAHDAMPLIPAAPGGTETILLVEDERGVRAVTRELLTQLGYRVLAAADGAEAIAMALAHDGAIDLLLTDVIMPGMNGMRVRDEVTKRSPHLKTLFMSGYPADVLERQGVTTERRHYLQKPFSRNTLAMAVRAALDE